MNYNLSTAPLFGNLGQIIYQKTGLFLGKRYTNNIATNQTITNLYLNIRSIDPEIRISLFFRKLLDAEFLNARETARFYVEWRELEKIFSSIPFNRMVWHCRIDEKPNGEVIERTDSMVIFKPSEFFLREFRANNDQWAGSKGKRNFETRTLRDAFWYQFEVISFVIENAVRMRRGIFIDHYFGT